MQHACVEPVMVRRIPGKRQVFAFRFHNGNDFVTPVGDTRDVADTSGATHPDRTRTATHSLLSPYPFARGGLITNQRPVNVAVFTDNDFARVNGVTTTLSALLLYDAYRDVVAGRRAGGVEVPPRAAPPPCRCHERPAVRPEGGGGPRRPDSPAGPSPRRVLELEGGGAGRLGLRGMLSFGADPRAGDRCLRRLCSGWNVKYR